jgi:hypothetical protein
MALFNPNTNLWRGLAIGLGATILGPIVLPAAARMAKPLAKSMIKAGILAYERGRETMAELGEVAEDIVAEARAELAEESARAADGAGGASNPDD